MTGIGRFDPAGPARLCWTRRVVGVVAAVLIGLASVTSTPVPAGADAIRGQQWYLSALGVPAAHTVSRGDGVTVAVLDSGVDAAHPDLTGSVLDGVDARTGSGNGQNDRDGHGTAMAAIIAGHGHGPANGDGMLGIAPRARILPIKLGGGLPNERFRPDEIARGIDIAVQRGAKVISASIASSPTEDMHQAVLRALDKDVVFVAATGNRDPGDALVYGGPAIFPGVMAIGATDRNGNHADFSLPATGLWPLAVSAPGVDAVAANPGGGYTTGRYGTSMSTAIVAGVVALIRSKYPTMPGYEVAHRITATAIDKGPPGVDPDYGHGLLNLDAALNANVPPTASPSPWIKRSPSPNPTAASPTPNQPPAAAPRDGRSGAVTALAAGVVVLLAAGAWWVLRRRSRG